MPSASQRRDEASEYDEVLAGIDPELLEALLLTDPAELPGIIAELPDAMIAPLLDALAVSSTVALPRDPASQAAEIDAGYLSRAHLAYLSKRLAEAVSDVQRGHSRHIVVSMPPRMGKSLLTSVYLPIWLLRRDPSWKIGLISHSPQLATMWGRQVRRVIEKQGAALGLSIAPDAGAVADWQTSQEGGIASRSAPGQSITGLGFKVMLIDDLVKDYAAAHSEMARSAVWDWWIANATTRLEPPYLAVVIGTRWHQDDFIGRLLSRDYDGDPDDWEVISFPARAEESDVLGREVGEPLLSPLVPDETPSQALERWSSIERSVGPYNWASQFQQRPAPAKGAIFDTDWWRYWSDDPLLAQDEPNVLYMNPADYLARARWIDSWDAAFKGSDSSDYVVGQRWARRGADRFLIFQDHEHWTFTQTLDAMRRWGRNFDPSVPYGNFVHERFIEDKANGPAIIDTLTHEVDGMRPVNPTTSKEARARAITPEIASHNVYLPHPSMPGFGWVKNDLLPELRSFPQGEHDDQVDALTQALWQLREPGKGQVTVPRQGQTTPTLARISPRASSRVAAARTDTRRRLG